MANIIIEFDEDSKLRLLEAMGKEIDSQGFIVEKNNPLQRVLTKEGEEVKFDEFAGVKKGSEVFIKKDINSILDLADTFE